MTTTRALQCVRALFLSHHASRSGLQGRSRSLPARPATGGADDTDHHLLLLLVNSVTRPKMPRIENDVKLDFKDVLIRPKR